MASNQLPSVQYVPRSVKGIQGPQGVQGLQGEQGIQGVQGPAGEQGIQGIQGIAGPQGIQGVKGDTGKDGVTGPQGVQGPTGSSGVSTSVSSIVGGTVTAIRNTAIAYFGMFLSSYNTAANNNENAVTSIIPYNCTISNLCFMFDKVPGIYLGKNWANEAVYTGYTFFIRKNKQDVINNSILVYQQKTVDNTVSIDFNAGDFFSILVFPTGNNIQPEDPVTNPADYVNLRWTCMVTKR